MISKLLILVPVVGALLLVVQMTSCSDRNTIIGDGYHSQVVTSSTEDYEVHVGGNLDEFNTRKYTGHYECAFQPNVSVTIANTGDTLVENPRIVVNGRRNWYSIDDIRNEVVKPGMNDKEKAFAVWDWCRRNISTGPGGGGIVYGKKGSLVIFMNSVGVGACGTFHAAMPRLANAVGVQSDSGCLANGSHAVQRNYWEGEDRYLDCMIPATHGEQPKGHFALMLDNKAVAGSDECREDHYLMDRGGPADYMNALLHGPGSSFSSVKDWPENRVMRFNLRPGESITREWKQIEKGWRRDAELKSNALGYLRYEVKLTDDQVSKYAEEAENLYLSRAGVSAADASKEARIAYRMAVPYVLVGGRVRLRCNPASDEKGSIEVQSRFDGRGTDWQTVWESEQSGPITADFRLPDYDEFQEKNPTHSFVVRIVIKPNGGAVSRLTIDADFQTYIPSLPALGAGKNTVRYVDDTQGPHEVRITHRFRTKTGQVPDAPVLKSPVGDDAPFNAAFQWTPPSNAEVDAYEFYLSAREDMAWPLLATFNTVSYSPKPEFRAITPDAFLDGETYYWKVRARSKDGTWGPWSKPAGFTARGPSAVENARVEISPDGRIVLRWDAPSSGMRPAKYEVFGAVEPSFSPLTRTASQIAWTTRKAIEREPNLIASTGELSFDVTNRREAFYRIVAVDAVGSPSPPTKCIDVPRPVLLPMQAVKASTGKELKIELPVRKSIGKLIWSLKEGLIREKSDELTFAVKGPAWLKIDPSTGVVTGTPLSKGSYTFTVEVSDQAGGRSSREYTVSVR